MEHSGITKGSSFIEKMIFFTPFEACAMKCFQKSTKNLDNIQGRSWGRFHKSGAQGANHRDCSIKVRHDGRPTVAERSKASVLRSWMRKVVGSNPGEGN